MKKKTQFLEIGFVVFNYTGEVLEKESYLGIWAGRLRVSSVKARNIT